MSTPLTAHCVIKASAGTGKTYALSNRYLQLLADGAAPESILATTFTRKAAGEILERVLARLARGCADARAAHDMAAAIGRPRVDLPRAREMLAQLCRSLHRVSISTIDSFFNRLAQSFRHELGIPPSPRLVDAGSPLARRMRLAAIDAVLSDDDPMTLVHLLRQVHHDSAQRSVTQAIDDLVTTLHDLYQQAPDAAAWSRIESPPPLDRGDLVQVVASLEALAAGATDKRFAEAIRKAREATLNSAWESILANGLTKAVSSDDPRYYKKPLGAPMTEVFRLLARHAAAQLLGRAARQTMAAHELVRRFDHHYQQQRRAQGVLLFSDLSHKLAHDLPALGDDLLTEVYYRLDSRVSHLMLDEFQDTSLEQWRVLRPLAEEIAAHADGSRSFFCVGDVKQSIYGWRGGCAEIFDRVEADLHLPPEASTQLTVSYRSSPIVLDAVNAVFSAIGEAACLEKLSAHVLRWARGFERHKAARELPGYVELVTSPAATGPATDVEEDDDDNGEGDEGNDRVLPSEHEQYVARRIAELHAAAPGRSLGVLTFRNRTAQRMVQMLRTLHVPASGEGGGPVTDDPAVGAVLAAITLADHPGDSVAAFHVFNSPLREVLGLTSDREPGTAEAAARWRRELLTRGVARCVSDWTRALVSRCSARSVARLTQLVELADAYEPDATLRPRDFVEYVRATAVEEPSPALVRVMTVHRAKGLEFDLVVLPELQNVLGLTRQQRFCAWRPSPTEAVEGVYASGTAAVRALSEELAQAYEQEVGRRTQDDLSALYVAMTRARHALHLVIKPIELTKTGVSSKGTTNASPASLLRQTLVPAEVEESEAGGEVLYERGAANWHALAPAPAREAGDEAARPAAVRLGRAATEPRRSWPTVTPSSLEGGRTVLAAQLLEMQTSSARQRGTIIHAWFEAVGFVDEASPTDAELTALADRVAAGADRTWLMRLMGQFRAMLDRPAVRAALSKPAVETADGTVELWRERAFMVTLDGSLMQGRIDRALVWRDATGAAARAEVLDYKTDRVEEGGANLDALAAHYRPQAGAYRQALSRMLGLPAERIGAKLLFLNSGDVRDV